jgi:hypothetical protein
MSTGYTVAIVLLIGLALGGFLWSMINGHRRIAATFVVLAIIMALPVRDLARAGYHTGERDRMVQQPVSHPG